MFCDLVGSTALSAQLDPEELREVVRAYQQTCGEIIARYEGHIAQYLGDGLLVYFGYPQAHEDDARRAVRAGLEILTTMQQAGGSNPRLPSDQHNVREAVAERQAKVDRSFKAGPQVRLGIHTGLVVIGEMGASGRTEQLALGETPNVAARIQSLAEPNTLLISAATHRLVSSQFEWQPFGSHLLKGIATPIAVYHVQGERQELAANTSHSTPLVGREQEVGLLHERWEQVTDGRGQIILLSGEPGIGKSRLTQTLTEHVTTEGSLALEARCSPYHQHSAFFPLIDAMQRTLFTREDTAETKVGKLERALALYHLPDALPLFAALLSLPLPADTPPLHTTPQKQKERTLHALVQWWLTQAERQATVAVWEDLHWADPSTLEFLTLLLEQVPTSRLLILLTARPEFVSPWPPRSHFVTLTLNRLSQKHMREMVTLVAEQAARPSTSSGRTDFEPSREPLSVRAEPVEARLALSEDLVNAIVAKTDGVPLFVEELTKSVLETLGAQGPGIGHRGTGGALAIPATLQDSLMARLDRLNMAKEIAQLGATLGREFSYDLLQAISPLTEDALQQGLRQLVEAELIYQRGLPPQAAYTFKHALIQDTAYHSLLKSRRQQLHHQIAQVLAERFPDTPPELLAHHYTEAGLIEQAVPYWQQAGERATQRSANQEAISHLTKGLELLKNLPDTLDRARQELQLCMGLNAPIVATKGFTSPELELTNKRAHELCQKLGETPEIFGVLIGLWLFHVGGQSTLQTAHTQAEQLLRLAQYQNDPARLQFAHGIMANSLFFMGELTSTREHVELGMVFHDAATFEGIALIGLDPRAAVLLYGALTSWLLGFPDRALKYSAEAVTLAQELGHPFNLAGVLEITALFHVLRGNRRMAQEQTEAAMTLSTKHGFPLLLVWGPMHQGWGLGKQGCHEQGRELLKNNLSLFRASGLVVWVPFYLGLLAELHGKCGQAEEGLSVLAEAFEICQKRGERWYEAELYRLKGELLLQQAREQAIGNG